MNNPEQKELDTVASGAQEVAVQTGGFSVLYHLADIEWIGGAIAGTYAVEKFGVNPWAAGATVAAAVTYSEYQLSSVAVRIFEKKKDIAENTSRFSQATKDLGAAAYGSIFGSANGVKINDSLGLESTPRRRKIQAAIFGCAVGLWVTPTPGFEQGDDAAREAVQAAYEDPKKAVAYSALSIGSILGISEVFKRTRKRFFGKKDGEQTSKS